jgi:hypothetical protein
LFGFCVVDLIIIHLFLASQKKTAVAWHLKGDSLSVVCKTNLQVWLNQSDQNEARFNRVSFELDGSDMFEKLSGHVSPKTWSNVWIISKILMCVHVFILYLIVFKDYHHQLDM